MANLKEIRTRIYSVESTMQITSAMKMVSAAKLKRAQDAIIQLLSAVWPPVFMLSLKLGYFLLGPAFLFTALWVNRNFLALCLREEGVLFTIISICCHSFLAMAVLAGALFELAQKPRLLFRIGYRGSQ